MSIDIDKYKFLCEYQKEQFNRECERFQKLEDKAFKYLTSLTVAFSAYLLLIRSIYSEIILNYNLLTVMVIFSIALTFYTACSSWSFIFRAIKLRMVIKMPSDNDVIVMFDNNKSASIYRGLAKQYSKATVLLSEEYNKKLHYVRKGYSEVAFTGWCFLISVTLIFIYLWSK